MLRVTRWERTLSPAVEISVAAFTGLMRDHHRRQSCGSASLGPRRSRARVLPFYVGLALAAPRSSISRRHPHRPAQDLRRMDAASARCLRLRADGRLRRADPFLGIYVSSALLIAAFMKWLGHYSWPITLLVAIGVPLVTFFLFEDWFWSRCQGSVEALLGY